MAELATICWRTCSRRIIQRQTAAASTALARCQNWSDLVGRSGAWPRVTAGSPAQTTPCFTGLPSEPDIVPRNCELDPRGSHSTSMAPIRPLRSKQLTADTPRRHDVQPIQRPLASMLKPWLAGKANGQPIFPVNRWGIIAALQADLRVAGVKYETEDGVADFHAMRHTYITALAKSNAPVKIVQSLARHSTPVLTLGVYTHLGLYDQAPALDALPDLTKPSPEYEPTILAATGTEGTTHKQTLAPSVIHSKDGLGRDQSIPDVIAGSTVPALMQASPLKNRDSDGYSRVLTVADANGSVSAAGARPGLQNR